MVPFAGWEMPVQYDGIKEEHIAVRTHAGIFDVSHMGQIEVEGPGSVAFLQRLVTNDVGRIEIGGAQYSLLLNDQAGVIDDLFVYRLGHDRFLVVTNAGNHGDDLARFGLVGREFDVYVRDVSSSYAMLAIQGPNARRTVSGTLHIDLPARMQVAARQIGRRPAIVCGTGYTGEDGVEILIDPEIAPAIWTELVDAGGTEQKLAPFVIEGAGIPRPGNAVLLNGETVGEVSSGTFSPSLERGIGMAYLRNDLAEPGTGLEIDVRGKRRAARVSSKPLYRKEK